MVDCERLAAERGTLRRVYALGQLARLEGLLADGAGSLTATFAFGRSESGGCTVSVDIEASPQLVCQRCMEAYGFPVAVQSEVEIASDPGQAGMEPLREVFRSEQGMISLSELAEEELLLALPLVPACSAPEVCGKAPALGELKGTKPAAQETVRPFAALQDLMKIHDRK